jgi:hypothetical protein
VLVQAKLRAIVVEGLKNKVDSEDEGDSKSGHALLGGDVGAQGKQEKR